MSLSNRLRLHVSEPFTTPVDDSISVPPVPDPFSFSRFQNRPRSDNEISTHCPVVRQTECRSEVKELQRLCQTATTKLANSFSILSLDDSRSQLVDTYDVSIRIFELENVLFKFEMKDIFSLRKTTSSLLVNLLSLLGGLSEDNVRSSNELFTRCG